MGNEMGFPNSKMGITAMTLTTPNIESKEIDVLVTELRSIAKAKNSEYVDKPEIDLVLKKLDKLDASDLELFAKLFTLFDMKGDATVNFRDYLAGIAGCLVTGKISDRIKFALSIFDDNSNGVCLKGEVKRALSSINNVAAYFGDPVLNTAEIDEILLALFAAIPKVTGQYVDHTAVIDFLLEHPLVLVFVRGEGKAKFGNMDAPVSA